jgi:hypothetical protein
MRRHDPVQSWVGKYRTGSVSHRIERSPGLVLLKFFEPFGVLRRVHDPVATAPGSVFVDSLEGVSHQARLLSVQVVRRHVDALHRQR